MGKQALEKRLESIQALRTAGAGPEVAAQLRKALSDRNNYLVSKAAAVAAELSLIELSTDLVAAFDRFLENGPKSDPHCWAKTAIAKTLKDLGYRRADPYRRGIAHVQLEPVWGGREDSAAALRGTCALALVDTDLDDLEIVGLLGKLLADGEKSVRIDAARAIAQTGRPEGAMLLRLKALCGDAEPEVMGQCFSAVLSLAGGKAVEFVSRFLRRADEQVVLEAASALAQSREAEAIPAIRGFLAERAEHRLRAAVVLFLGGAVQAEAAELLLELLESESGEVAANAVLALAASRFREEVRARVERLVRMRRDAQLDRVYAEQFPDGVQG